MRDPSNIVLVGGGGHCKSVIDVAESAGYTILGILDMPEYVGSSVLGYPVIGTDEDLVKYVDKALFIVTVGHIKDAYLRIRLHEHIQSVGGRLATIVASTFLTSEGVIRFSVSPKAFSIFRIDETILFSSSGSKEAL